MLSVNKLEKVIELEENLRAEYTSQLAAKDAEIERLSSERAELQTTVDSHQATIEKQLETIKELSGQSADTQRVEQLNRELNNRSDNLQTEVAELKKRVKTMQKELATERTENKTLKQYDPLRMKKNLDANKKKLADEARANALLQKSINKTRGENAELQAKVEELEAKLSETEAESEPTETAGEEAA